MVYPLPSNPRTRRPHEYVEAFCLMKYRDTLGNEEWIWNSRDGITPFCVTSKLGMPADHVEFSRDRYLPNHVPNVGDRIFVNLTPAVARAWSVRWYERFAQDAEHGPHFLATYPNKDAAIAEHALTSLEQFWPCSPHLVEVTPELRATFLADTERRST